MIRKGLILGALASLFGASTAVTAGVANCTGVYVGLVGVSKAGGLSNVIFLDDPSNANGSYSVNFSGWTETSKRTALAMLTSAKYAKQKLDVVTEAPDGCGLTSGGTTLKEIYLQNRR